MPFRCPTTRRALAATGALVTVGALLTAGPAGGAVPGRELDLTFEHGHIRHNSADAAFRIRRVTDNGGAIITVPDRQGTGSAARFPLYQVDNAPEAVLTVVDAEDADDLDPGTAKFRFGADFALDAESEGSSTDNGNNLVQRGLYSATTQYKLQLDDGFPECRVKGRDGVVDVASTRAVTPGRWYRAVCLRDGNTVQLVVKRLNKKHRTWTYSASGKTGSMKPDAQSLPLSVGGKVTSRGTLRADDADQFNGLVDNVFLHIY
jgi:hypothetical protein